MSLYDIIKTHEPPTKGPVTGYKIFTFNSKTNMIIGLYMTDSYKFNRIYNAEQCTISLGINYCSKNYQSGFHFFSTRQDARKFLRNFKAGYKFTSDPKIYKILAYDIRIEGIDIAGLVPTHVADRIKILKETVR